MVKIIRRKVMYDVEMILSRVKETMDREDIRKLVVMFVLGVVGNTMDNNIHKL